jgi:uncharacterized membrane protein HdeD (DUF308 family)
MYLGDLPSMLIYFAIMFVVSTIFSLFSPFGIGFIIFSIIRIKTESEKLRTTSLIFQIILSVLTFIVGLLIAWWFFAQNNMGYNFSNLLAIFPFIGIFFGVCLVVVLQIIIIFWETFHLK